MNLSRILTCTTLVCLMTAIVIRSTNSAATAPTQALPQGCFSITLALGTRQRCVPVGPTIAPSSVAAPTAAVSRVRRRSSSELAVVPFGSVLLI
jgi:hypothetical protein